MVCADGHLAGEHQAHQAQSLSAAFVLAEAAPRWLPVFQRGVVLCQTTVHKKQVVGSSMALMSDTENGQWASALQAELLRCSPLPR